MQRISLIALLACIALSAHANAGMITYELQGTTTVWDSWGFGDGSHEFTLNVTYDDKSYNVRPDASLGDYLWPHQEAGFLGGTLTIDGVSTDFTVGFLELRDNQTFLNGDFVYIFGRSTFNGARESFVSSFVVDSGSWSFTGDTATLPTFDFGDGDFVRSFGSWDGQVSYTTDARTLGAQPVPEPSSLALLGTAGIGFCVMRRRRQRMRSAGK